MAISEIQQCLTLLKQALHCPICLDALKSPAITPCAHIFCNFCILGYINSKRSVKCPLCNKQITKRGLSSADKFEQIATVSEEIFKNFATESQVVFIPVTTFDQLNLSQEFSQIPAKNVRITSSTETLCIAASRSRRVSTITKRDSRRGSRIAANRRVVSLGTSARVLKANMLANSRAAISNNLLDANDIESTQPMSNLNNSLDFPSTKRIREEDDANLFVLTQTAPIINTYDTLNEFIDLSSRCRTSDKESNPQPFCGAAMQRINSELIPGPFTTSFAMRHPPSRRSMKRNLSETANSTDGSENKLKNVSKLSLSSFKRKSFLRGWRIRKSSDSTQLSDASSIVIPPLRERLSAHFKTKPTNNVYQTPQKQKRTSNELYSPWLRNRLHFLKKYKVGSGERRVVSSDKKNRDFGSSLKSRVSLPKHFSPGWSRAKNVNSEFSRQSKAKLLIRSTKKKFMKSTTFKKPPSEATKTPPKPEILHTRSICPFYIPTGRVGNLPGVEPEITFVICTECGTKILLETTAPRQTRAEEEKIQAVVTPTACPIVHEKYAYWPEAHQYMLPPQPSLQRRRSQLTISPAPTSMISIQPSFIPQTWSLDTLTTQAESCNNEKLTCSTITTETITVTASPMTANAITEPLTLFIASRNSQNTNSASNIPLSSSAEENVNIDPSLVPETPFSLPYGPANFSISSQHQNPPISDFKYTSTSKRPFNVPETNFISSVGSISSPSQSISTANFIRPSMVPETPFITPTAPQSFRINLSSAVDIDSCELMPTIEREQLRQECADLEAEVAELQQQLEAEALSPNETAELLANAGTEMEAEDNDNEEECISASPHVHPEQYLEEPTKEEEDDATLLSPNLSVTHIKENVSDMEVELGNLDLIPDTNAMDVLDVIPSSQQETEEELEEIEVKVQATNIVSIDEQTIVLGDRTVFPHISSVSSVAPTTSASCVAMVTRVENSQQTSASINFQTLPLQAHTKISAQITTPFLCADSMPLSLPTQFITPAQPAGKQHPVESSSMIEDTENMVPAQSTDKSPVPTIFVTGSNLSPMETNSLRRFCKLFNVIEDSRFIPGQTTHVIMASETTRPRVAQRTLKYFMGILHRAWIVNTIWLRKCLLANTLLSEELFEIQGDTVCGDCHEGPRRGRLGVPALPLTADPFKLTPDSNVDRRPFAGLRMCSHGEIGALSKADFGILVEAGGGTVVDSPNQFPIHTLSQMDVKRKKNLRQMILTSPTSSKFSLDECKDLYKKYNVPIVNINWLLNCASVYRRLPMNQIYIIYPVD